MTLFSPDPGTPCFAVILTSQRQINDIHYRLVSEKMLELASDQPGYLGSQYSLGEVDHLVTYWRTLAEAEAWRTLDTMRRLLSIGEKLWYEQYTLSSFELLKGEVFLPLPNGADTVYSSRFPRLESKRGVLKILDISQAGLLYDYVNQEKAFLSSWEPKRSDAYFSLETCRLRIKAMQREFLEDTGITLCFLTENEDKMLAYSHYSNLQRGVFQSCNLGYSLRESEQGRGIMNEALKLGIQYLHETMQIDRIQAAYMPRNAKSAEVLRKLGFKKEGLAKRYLNINGAWEDHVLAALVLR